MSELISWRQTERQHRLVNLVEELTGARASVHDEESRAIILALQLLPDVGLQRC